MKTTISDKTEIFDPKIDFGEWCQQDGGIGSPTSHSSTKTMTLILKHLEEKFSIQLRSRALEEHRAVKFQWVKRTTALSPWQSLPQICFVLRKGCSVMWSVGNMRFWTELLASRGILHEVRFYVTLSGVLSDLHSRSPLSWTGRNKGKGREFPDSQAWLCETGNRYRTEVIFFSVRAGRSWRALSQHFRALSTKPIFSCFIPNNEQPTEHSGLEVSYKDKVQTSTLLCITGIKAQSWDFSYVKLKKKYIYIYI